MSSDLFASVILYFAQLTKRQTTAELVLFRAGVGVSAQDKVTTALPFPVRLARAGCAKSAP
jgi:hypothetical protein